MTIFGSNGSLARVKVDNTGTKGRIPVVSSTSRLERQGRHRESNLKDAKLAIIAMLDEKAQEQRSGVIAQDRKAQVGSGMRGDKIRTYREQDDTVKDHRTGKSMPFSRLLKECSLDRLW